MATVEATLPTWEELEAFWNRTSNVIEAVDSEIGGRVFAVTNREGEQTVTFEQIGQLLIFVDWMREQVKYLAEALDKIEQATKLDLDMIRREGENDVPTFDRHGFPTPPLTAREVAQLVAKKEAGDA